MSNEGLSFTLPYEQGVERVLAALGKSFTLVENPVEHDRFQYFDTFDWRLFKKQRIMAYCKPVLELQSLDHQEQEFQIDCNQAPVFVWDLPEGPLRNDLEPVLEMRALLPLVDVDQETRRYNLLNGDDKTTVRFEIWSRKVMGPDKEWTHLDPEIAFFPLRGYEREYQQALKKVEKWAHSKTHSLVDAFKSVGLTPLDYNSKPNLGLHPEMRSDEAGKQIYSCMMEVIRRNMDGIRKDLDSEFLHDFRVAVRRTRSGLSQIKNILEDDVLERAKTDFSTLGKMTNLMRDLDVYLLKHDEYRNLLPVDMQPDVERFFVHLRDVRKKERSVLLKKLASPEVSEIFGWWEAFLSEPVPEHPQPIFAALPVLELANKSILKRYKRVCRDGALLRQDSPDQLFHDLRIECKKLRYQLEFFISLYPKGRISNLVSRLKKLQNGLGDFNDFYVQQETLKAYVHEMSVRSNSARDHVLAIGVLIGVLCEKQRNLKAVCMDGLKTFLNHETRQLFHDTFKAQKGGKK